MPAKKNFLPRTRRQDERLVERNVSQFGVGLVKDEVSVSKGFSELFNAIDYQDNVKGMNGTSLFNVADFATDSNVTYTLKNRIANDPNLSGWTENSTLLIYTHGDFDSEPLKVAKLAHFESEKPNTGHEVPRPYDVYETYTGEDTEVHCNYLGNLLIPYYEDYVALDDEIDFYDFQVTKSGAGIILQSNSTSPFTSDVVGKYLTLGADPNDVNPDNPAFVGKRFLITQYIDADTIVVDDSSTDYDGTWERCLIQAITWASYDFAHQDKRFIHCGNQIYWTDSTLFKWEKVVFFTDIRPNESFSKFEQTEREFLLTNQNGIFRFEFKTVNGKDTVFAYVMNSDFKNLKIVNPPRRIFGFPDSNRNMDSENSYYSAGFSGKDVFRGNSQTGGQVIDKD